MALSTKELRKRIARLRAKAMDASLPKVVRAKAKRQLAKRRAQLSDRLRYRSARLRVLSPRGLNFIAGYEGWRAKAYNDAAGHATIGFGHLLHYGPVTAKERTLNWSRAHGARVLRKDIRRLTAGWRGKVRVKLTQGEYDALVSFAFNVGAGGLSTSTLLKKLNDGDRAGAADEFLKWNRAGGRVLEGLTRRREAERRVFLSK